MARAFSRRWLGSSSICQYTLLYFITKNYDSAKHLPQVDVYFQKLIWSKATMYIHQKDPTFSREHECFPQNLFDWQWCVHLKASWSLKLICNISIFPKRDKKRSFFIFNLGKNTYSLTSHGARSVGQRAINTTSLQKLVETASLGRAWVYSADVHRL